MQLEFTTDNFSFMFDVSSWAYVVTFGTVVQALLHLIRSRPISIYKMLVNTTIQKVTVSVTLAGSFMRLWGSQDDW